MATGNIFLGTGRRSVGDVTLYRVKGKQRARVRVRQVANPRTYKQLLSRAIISNVAQLYSAGQEIFNHSFQGYAAGQDNQLRFQKINIGRLRSKLVADFNNKSEYADCLGRIGARNVKCPVPFYGMIVSEGTYEQQVWTYDSATCAYKLPPVTEATTVADYASLVGLVPGDIFTFCGFVVRNYKDYIADFDAEYYGRIYPTYWQYFQLKVKDGVLEDTSALTGTDTLLKLFDFAKSSSLVTINVPMSAPYIDANVLFVGDSLGGIACIRSRYDSDLRSTSELMPSSEDGMEYGLTIHFLVDAWGEGTGIDLPERILSGKNFR